MIKKKTHSKTNQCKGFLDIFFIIKLHQNQSTFYFITTAITFVVAHPPFSDDFIDIKSQKQEKVY